MFEHINWTAVGTMSMLVGTGMALGGLAKSGIDSVVKSARPYILDRSQLARDFSNQERRLRDTQSLLKRADESLRISADTFESVKQTVDLLTAKVELLTTGFAELERKFKVGIAFIATIIREHEKVGGASPLPQIPAILRDDVEDHLRVTA